MGARAETMSAEEEWGEEDPEGEAAEYQVINKRNNI